MFLAAAETQVLLFILLLSMIWMLFRIAAKRGRPWRRPCQSGLQEDSRVLKLSSSTPADCQLSRTSRTSRSPRPSGAPLPTRVARRPLRSADQLLRRLPPAWSSTVASSLPSRQPSLKMPVCRRPPRKGRKRSRANPTRHWSGPRVLNGPTRTNPCSGPLCCRIVQGIRKRWTRRYMRLLVSVGHRCPREGEELQLPSGKSQVTVLVSWKAFLVVIFLLGSKLFATTSEGCFSATWHIKQRASSFSLAEPLAEHRCRSYCLDNEDLGMLCHTVSSSPPATSAEESFLLQRL